jgi:hypothetical protein
MSYQKVKSWRVKQPAFSPDLIEDSNRIPLLAVMFGAFAIIVLVAGLVIAGLSFQIWRGHFGI